MQSTSVHPSGCGLKVTFVWTGAPRAFVFCALHAHMRLTEELVKDMFGRAIDSRRVQRLKDAFKTHLNLENKFVRLDNKHGKWNKVSLYGYECWRFAEVNEQGVSNL